MDGLDLPETVADASEDASATMQIGLAFPVEDWQKSMEQFLDDILYVKPGV